jgi:probable HAF family extracellular repeat protein
MVTSVRRKWFLLPILGIALLAGGLVVHVEGGKPQPPPPPPPVLYDIQLWTPPAAFPHSLPIKMNKWGQVVGRCWDANGVSHGFLYDPSTDLDCAIDLSTLPIAGIPDGWMIRSAVGINDDGVIVGSLQPIGDLTKRKGYILDTRTWTLELLPDPQPSSFWYCSRINNFGDVLVGYQDDTTGAWGARMYKRGATDWGPDAGVNAQNVDELALSDNGQVALQVVDGTSYGAAYRWTPSTHRLERIPSGQSGSVVYAYGINDAGTVCGWTGAKPPKGTKGGPGAFPFRYTDSLEVLFDLGAGSHAAVINSDSDLLCWNGFATDHVYQDTLGSFYAVDSLIDPSDLDAAIWCSKSYADVSDMNNRIGTTGFGQIVGQIFFADGSHLGFLLTPRLP